MAPIRLDRLLVALPSTRMGGTERHSAEVAARLAARGLAVKLLAEAALQDQLRPLAGGAVIVPARIGLEEGDDRQAGAARQEAELAAALPLHRPDVVMVPLAWPDAGVGLMRAAAAAGLPRLVLFHLAPDGDAPDGSGGARALGLDGAVLAAVSAPVAERAARFLGVAPGSVAVVPNPAPAAAGTPPDVARATLRGALGLAPDEPLIIFVGRLEEAKGADLLPEISARLDATLACLGEGRLRGLLQARAAGDPRGRLRVVGPVAEPGPWYLAADALLLPSRLEGAPLVFLEAAANRLPVVATFAALEALGPDAPRLAWIAEPTVPALAAAVEEALGEAAASAARVEAAAAHAAGLDWEGTVDRLLGMLRAAPVLARRVAA